MTNTYMLAGARDPQEIIASVKRVALVAERNTPLRRNVTIEEVGNVAAFLCSDLAAGVTGDVVYVDSGFHVTAMGSGPL